MRTASILLLSLLAAGCSREVSNNATNASNVVAEEGIEDVNSSIEGDQLSPDVEAVDDLARNGAVNTVIAPAK